MMEKIETIEAHFPRLMEIKNEMELNGYEVEDEMFVKKVLNNLPLKFDYIVAVLQEMKDFSKMSIEELHGSLILHESRINERLENLTKKDSTEKALQALTPKGNGQGQSNDGGGDSHARGQNFRACGRSGGGNYQGRGRGNFQFQQRGSIPITLKNGKKSSIGGVYYVPNLHHSLLSLGQLQEKNYDLNFRRGVCTIRDERLGLIVKMDNANSIMTPAKERLRLTKDSNAGVVNSTYFKSLVGSLRYLTSTRLDINFSVGLINRFRENPRQSHLQAVKRILRYIKGTQGDDILYAKGEPVEFLGYIDSDWAEAEYIATSNCATQAVWLRRMLGFLQHKQDDSAMVFCDNKSAIELTKNPVFQVPLNLRLGS
ncbi:hypothetical protein ZIOFF_037290 [Zingiber officinale]|uniref:Retrovirus-related Pol polyprotein from transposon TNT 1-94-like beta-barrel domain-containing protein n=1 Tax=Zingiber officinale TaxID=94328 RepID=A0A8J5L405_ZINOF|nr:hypothetical protein ZIOFF_037290 [Zingiber officinale]